MLATPLFSTELKEAVTILSKQAAVAEGHLPAQAELRRPAALEALSSMALDFLVAQVVML